MRSIDYSRRVTHRVMHLVRSSAALGAFASYSLHASPPTSAVAAKTAPFDVAKACGSNPRLGTLVKDVFPNPEARNSVAAALASGSAAGAGCARALDEGLAEIASGKPSDLVKENKVGLLLLAAEARRNGLSKALAVTIATEQQKTEWFGALLDANRTEGRRALRLWFSQTATGLRETQKLAPVASDLYGKAASSPLSQGLDDVKLTNPLLFARYLGELKAAGFDDGEREMADFALVYALQDAASRRLYADSVASLVSRNEGLFLSAFRKEHPLVQFRLVPLMANAKTPAFVRELLWISNNHADVRVRSLASGALDAAVESARPAR